MKHFMIFACAVVLVAAQKADPKQAKILKEQRFNAGDGRAGSAFATEDGVIFKEETDINGNRIGQYSYVGDDGKTYVVKYSAGKEGFRILGGDHVPSTGLDAAVFVAEEPAQPAIAQPVAEATPVQQVRVAAARPVAIAEPQAQFVEVPADPNRNPFINPHDPTHRNFQFNQHAAQFDPSSPGARAASLVPNCADCAGVNPFVNPFDSSHQAGGGVLAGHLAGHGAGQPVAARKPAAPIPSPKVQTQALPQALRTPTTLSPRNFFPPGQLKLNRFETGFNFDFQS